MNRRNFPARLLALGASAALPVPVVQASPEQIDAAWQELQHSPLLSAVDRDLIILDPLARDPVFRHDVYSLDERDFETSDTVICMAEFSRFELRLWKMAKDRYVEAVGQLRGELTVDERHRVQTFVESYEADIDEGWRCCVEWEGAPGLPMIRAAYELWLDQELDDGDIEYLPPESGQRGKAWRFFDAFDPAALARLGVVVVDGDHAGSSCRYAKLTFAIDQANAAAQDLGVPFRFRPELPDLRKLPEDPAIRLVLTTAGVPHREWPPYPISGADAACVIAKHEERRT